MLDASSVNPVWIPVYPRFVHFEKLPVSQLLIIDRIQAKKTITMGRQKDPRQLEKLILYILARRPDEFGLVPDDQGFLRLKDLLKAISEEPGWGYVRKSHIQEVLLTSCEKSFVLENDKIRAVFRDRILNPDEEIIPPKLLYHCVRRRAYPVVCRRGVIPLGQPRVLLATTEKLAQRIGRRRDPAPVLLTIQAKRAFEAGVKFSKQGEFIYMTDHVPVGYFTGPPLPKEKKKEDSKPKKESVAIPEALPGSFTFDRERSRALQQQQLRQKGLKKEIAWKKDVRRSRRKRKR
jgi:putative RNA 2'-phosphotransferase